MQNKTLPAAGLPARDKPAEQEPVVWIRRESLDCAAVDRANGFPSGIMTLAVRHGANTIPLYLHPQPAPAVQGEPVAWQLRTPEGRVILNKEFPAWADAGYGYKITPLYTAPQPAEYQPECGCCGQTDQCDDDCDAVVIGGHRAAEQQPLKSSLALDVATHLTYWMELDWCECEGGHTCGLNEVRRTRDALLVAAEQQPAPHPDDDAVDRFAAAMKAKLNENRREGRGGWQSMTAEQLSALLHEHVRKGDPVDVANLAMMLHQNGQVIELPEPPVNVVTDEMVEAVQRIWKTAMMQSVVARVPECGEFGGIAQDADWLLDVLMEARND